MTKENLQKELKEKVKEGIKPSDLKKLKRSKSADDIPTSLTPPNLVRSKSTQELEPAPNQEEWEDKISVLELTVETKDRELIEKAETITIYSDQLQTKQKEIEHLRKQGEDSAKQVENLRKQLEEKNEELKKLKAEQSSLLDDNLTLKHKGLKDWFTQYQQTQKLEQELVENVNHASEELVNQDKQINSLQGQVKKLKQQNQSLQKDLESAEKLAELRKSPYPNDSDSYPFLKYTLYSLVAILFTLLLVNNLKNHQP